VATLKYNIFSMLTFILHDVITAINLYMIWWFYSSQQRSQTISLLQQTVQSCEETIWEITLSAWQACDRTVNGPLVSVRDRLQMRPTDPSNCSVETRRDECMPGMWRSEWQKHRLLLLLLLRPHQGIIIVIVVRPTDRLRALYWLTTYYRLPCMHDQYDFSKV